MHPNLVGPACLQFALNEGNISKTLNHLVVGYCMLAYLTVGRKSLELESVIRVPSNIGIDANMLVAEKFSNVPWVKQISASRLKKMKILQL